MTTGDDDATAPRQVHVSELLAAHGRTVVPSGRRRRRVEPEEAPEPAAVPAEPAEPAAVPVEPAAVAAEPVAAEPVTAERHLLLDLPEPAAAPVEDETARPDDRTPEPEVDPDPVPTASSDLPAAPREVDDAPAPASSSPAREWALIGAQLVGALVAGGALWFAFRALWEWQSAVAFVLSAVVIVGLVVVVRVLRRAEDTFSTMLAVLAGLIVTVSPPVLTLTGS